MKIKQIIEKVDTVCEFIGELIGICMFIAVIHVLVVFAGLAGDFIDGASFIVPKFIEQVEIQNDQRQQIEQTKTRLRQKALDLQKKIERFERERQYEIDPYDSSKNKKV